MKKTLIALILVAFVLGGSVANTQIVSAADEVTIQAQIDTLLQKVELLQKILALLQRIEALQLEFKTQLQTVTPSPQASTPEVIPAPQPQILSTSTTVEAPALVVYNPSISILKDGNSLFWKVDGGKEDFNCKLNGVSVTQENNVLMVDQGASFTLECIGRVTGTQIRKTI